MPHISVLGWLFLHFDERKPTIANPPKEQKRKTSKIFIKRDMGTEHRRNVSLVCDKAVRHGDYVHGKSLEVFQNISPPSTSYGQWLIEETPVGARGTFLFNKPESKETRTVDGERTLRKPAKLWRRHF